ncbi:glucose-6-phosphate dehydrogenase [Sphingomonas sp. HDW15A]|uniref:glucose-6-phosphate dehydrogenase n=1 Tax=Sphingomonas sp. HDW15A TaxID=2714942 RepID=UPI00140B5A6A|nr:glucose-6-phosphate dehydrogenase [Sphingomonas sp. HDW15A]QIK96750.1 glucose-6-phosphate dehydrogenase [Sphingomonas sp. HDW15A]
MGASALLLFGATGDLARRMLLPSLYALYDDGLLPKDLRIVGTARSALDDRGYRDMAEDALSEFLPGHDRDGASIPAFLEHLYYHPMDILAGDDGFSRLSEKLEDTSDGLSIFLSTAPSLFEPTIRGLQAAGLAHDGVRIGLEKPLGTDLQSSCEINDAVASAFPEDRIFRIDHYLGKETVQNLLALRFANVLFEPLWNEEHIDHVQITVAETVGLEGRVDYYDGVGALRDMVQNHVLQLLALVAMEPPSSFDATAVRDEKVKVLRSLRPITCDDSVLGQYEGYDAELKRDSATETFVALKANVDNWRWAGVPFYLRTGKKLAERRTEIVVQFKPIPHNIFASRGANSVPNRLIIAIQPQENIHLSVMAKVPGLDRGGIKLREVPLDISMPDAFAGPRRRIAYERLLLDLIEGDQTLFVRRDEVEAQWQWIDAVRACWTETAKTPEVYQEGSLGPEVADALVKRDGRVWHD